MVKQITKYLAVIAVLAGLLFAIDGIKNSSDSLFSDKTGTYYVNNTQGYIDSLDLGNVTAAVGKVDTVNSDFFSDCYYALLINDTDNAALVAKDVHKRMYPASLTKIMTGIIVCDKVESGELSLDDMVTVNHHYDLTYEGVGACPISYGSSISLKNLLYALMLESNNYYALIIADYVAGSESAFCELMNQKAMSIGATNTHYVNPHGLDNPNHYSTAYDTYLIIREAYTHDIIKDIDTFDYYAYSYTNGSGYTIETDATPTNKFINGGATIPAGYNILTWKTGTTSAAGNCLAMYLEKAGKLYVAIASSPDSKAVLYDNMVKLLCVTE